MALRIWMPLNGNIENKGLSNANITLSGATLGSYGKIGKTYSFDANDDYISIDSADLRNCFKGGANPFSIAMWIYNIKTTGSRAVPFGDYGLTGTANFNLEINSSAGDWSNDIRFYWNGNPDYRASGTALTTNAWIHLAIVYDGTKLDFYRNGTLVNTRTGTLAAMNKTSGAFYLGRDNRTGGTAFGGCLNDVRIYDEALSAKQVKEISKGLVAHYKLTGVGSNPNLAIGTNGNTTSINSFTMSLQNGGNTRTVEQDETGVYCTKIVRNDVAYSGWKYMSQNNFDKNAIKTSTTYTVSLDIKSTVSGSMSLTGLLNGNGTNYMTNSTTTINGTIIANQWNHLVYRCTTINDFSNITVGNQVIYFGPSNELVGTGVVLWIKNVKLEEGNKDTGWIPYTSDSLYTKLGYGNDICTDVSGNGYTAEKVGALTFNNNSPRYDGCTIFDNSYLHKIPSPLHANSDAFSISCWFYPTRNSTQALINDRKATGDGLSVFYLSGGIRFDTGSSYQWQVGNITLNAWNYVVVTWNKNAGNKKLYINGNLINTTTSYGTLANIGDVFSIGNSSANGAAGAGNQVYGSLSDFRIYATALSADDVLTMYKNSGIIDNKGNIYAYEFKEE